MIYEIPKVTHFQWIRLRKLSADICLSFKLVIEKRFQIKITGAVKKLGKIWPLESRMFSYVLSIVKLKLCRVVRQGYVSNH